LSYYLAHRQAPPLEVMLGAARWYHRRAVRATERVEGAIEREDANRRDQLATIKKLLALAVHPATPPEEAAWADAKAGELLAAYAEGLSGTDAAAIAAANANPGTRPPSTPRGARRTCTGSRRWMGRRDVRLAR
jgi:hypothetical protein